MKKYQLIKLWTVLLTVSIITALFSGCTAAILDEGSQGDSTLTAKPASSIPTTTPPSYYAPPTPDNDGTYTPEYQLSLLAERDFEGAIFLAIQEKGLENAIFPSADELTEVYADRRNRLISQ